MNWSLAFPNLLIGLREGLEAGLVVTILVSAVRKLAPGRSLAAVWFGVAAAVVVSLSFGAVLTFTRAELSPRAQEIFGGTMSLLAVALVTSMIFWMRGAAKAMAGDLRDRVSSALVSGGAALVVTAFVAVAREGLEAALFVWTNAQAAGSSTSPLVGALLGLLIAAALCVGLYRRVLKINLTRFFTVTGAVLVVIVAGVLAYGLKDLQEAGVLPGADSAAFDVSAQIPTGRWWTELVRGVTNLDNRMSWLQVIAYVGYIAVVMTLFLRRRAGSAAAAPEPPAQAATGRPRRVRLIAGGALLVPVVLAGVLVATQRKGSVTASQATAVSVTTASCAPEFTSARTGRTVYAVTNSSGTAVDVEIVDTASKAILAEIEVLGPGTTRELPVTLGAATYQFTCGYAGSAGTTSASHTATGPSQAAVAVASLKPATTAELAPVLTRYRAFVGAQLALLDRQTAALDVAVRAGDRPAAKAAWLTAHLTYHRVGAAYAAFGDAGEAVDGLAQGLPGGVTDRGFVGLHRIEYGLWHGQPLASLTTYTAALVKAADGLHAQLGSFTFDPNDVTTRAHEIIEDTIRFTLTAQDDYGSGSGFETAQADLDGDRYLIGLLAASLTAREPALVAEIKVASNRLHSVLATAIATGRPVAAAPIAVRQQVNAAAGELAETVAPVPDLLELRTQ